MDRMSLHVLKAVTGQNNGSVEYGREAFWSNNSRKVKTFDVDVTVSGKNASGVERCITGLTSRKGDQCELPVKISLDEIAKRAQPLCVDGIAIPNPDSGKALIESLGCLNRCVKSSIFESCHIECEGGRGFNVIPEMIGEGKHCRVYGISAESGGVLPSVLKLTKPDESSICSIRKDIDHSGRWFNCKPQFFSVPGYLYCDGGARFRIVEKSEGISLTKLLVGFGVIKFDVKQTDRPVVMIDADRIDNIPELVINAIEEMLGLIRENPQLQTSLSPNNIYATCTKTTEGSLDDVSRMELVDIGAGMTKDYSAVYTFADYLKNLQKTGVIEKYLTHERYSYDLASLKEWQASARYGELQSNSR